MAWWRDAVLYHVYLRSFADSDGDGVGDLAGLIGRLDHLEWLGVDALWLSPVGRSANEDWGYDVCSYDEVDPELGTGAELERLIEDAGGRGIKIVLDLVPNHTSDRHPWFADPAKRDWYVWEEPGPGRWPAEQLEVDLRRRRPGSWTRRAGSTTCTTSSSRCQT